MGKRALVLLLLLFYSTPNFATGIDSPQLDVAGVRLGMSVDEVVAALIAHFKVSLDKVIVSKSGRYGEAVSIEYKGMNEQVRVFAHMMPPYGAQTAAHVESVTYSVESTVENIDALKTAVIEKYGEPDGWYGSSTWRDSLVSLEWCAKPTHTLPPRCSESSEPILKYGGARVTLNNQKYSEIRSEYYNKSKLVKPKL